MRFQAKDQANSTRLPHLLLDNLRQPLQTTTAEMVQERSGLILGLNSGRVRVVLSFPHAAGSFECPTRSPRSVYRFIQVFLVTVHREIWKTNWQNGMQLFRQMAEEKNQPKVSFGEIQDWWNFFFFAIRYPAHDTITRSSTLLDDHT